MVKESRPRMAIRSNQSVRSRSTRQLRSKTNHYSPENQSMGVGLARVIHSFARCSALLLVIGTLVDVSAVNGTHYRGGTISWSPAPPSTSSNRTVVFTFRLAWSLQHEHCDNNTIASNQLIGDANHKWICAYGCAGPIAPTRIYCSAFNVEQDWATGSNSFSQTFDNNGPFDISYMYCCWAQSLMTATTSEWSLTTKVLLGVRSDTGLPNNSPVVKSPLSIRLEVGVPFTIQLETVDLDGDEVRCRLGNYFGECGNTCTLHNEFLLDSVNCQITYNPTTNITGLVPIALTVEDFSRFDTPIQLDDVTVRPGHAISSIPFQFIVQLEENEQRLQDRCLNVKPRVTINPNSEVFFVKVNRTFQVIATASACHPRDSIRAFNGSGPIGVLQSNINIVNREASISVSWTPNAQQSGRHTFCFSAEDTNGLFSDQTCFTVVVDQELKYCRGIGGSEYITFDHLHYSFAGRCQYQLALTTFNPLYAFSNNLQPFNISVTNDATRSGEPRISVIKVTIAQRFVELRRNRRVIVDGEQEILPIVLSGFRIDIRGRFVTMTTTSGAVIKFDGETSFIIGLPTTYSGHVQGLCGNMNNDASDEFLDSRRKSLVPVVMNPLEFGNRFVLGRCNTPPVQYDECSRPSNAANMLACSLLTATEGCFSQCHSVISPDPFYQSCITALCRSTVYQRTTLKIQIGSYADACQLESAEICNWRDRIGAAMECLPNSRYVACGMSEPQTCANLNSPPLATTSCVEGCQCDEGYLLSGDQCVHQSTCGCFIQGKYRLPGFSFRTSDCMHECTCMGVNRTSCIPAPPCGVNEHCGVRPDGFSHCFERTLLPATCHALGDPHYQTFDGAAFDSMSTCAHIMVRSRADSTITPFTVIAINDQPRINQTVSHVSEVHIVFGVNQTRITLKEGPVIMVNGAIAYPGASFDGFTIRKVGVFVILSFNFGLVVRWDGVDRLRISAWSPLSRHVEGLCGNFDGDPTNDFAAANGGGLITDVDQFVNSWMVTGPDINGNLYPIPQRNSTEICISEGFTTPEDLANCIALIPQSNYSCRLRRVGDVAPPCSDNNRLLSHMRDCAILTSTTGPFAPCHGIINPRQDFNNCVFDLCAYGGNQSYMERILSSYDYDCRERNITVTGWREVLDLPFQCSGNMVFSSCMSQCQATCFDPDRSICESNLDIGTHCIEGCQCPNGFVQSSNDSGCVPQELCGCVVNGRYQLRGFIYRQNNCTEECVCMGNNVVQCNTVPTCKINLECRTDPYGYQSCHGRLRRRATCKAVTDPHYMTFDRTRFDSMGTCAYIMIRNIVGSRAPNFTVIAVNVQPLPHQIVSHVKEVHILFNGNETMVFQEGPVVKWNGRVILPGTTQSNFVVTRGGRFIVVEFDFRLVIKWDGIDRVRIHAWQELREQVEGLCGDFDDDASNDFRTSWGEVTTNLTTFVRSWEASGYSAEGCFLPPPANASDICPSQDALQRFGRECSLLMNRTGPFADCHTQVNPWNSFRDCLFDLCATNGSSALKDRVFSSYTTDCLGADRQPSDDWRQVADLPVNCPANQHYNVSAPSCQPSCTDPQATNCNISDSIDFTNVEGCQCNDSYILSGLECVRREECGCLVNGIYVTRGFEWRTEDCSMDCVCLGLNGTQCVPAPTCPKRSRCQVDSDGFRRCVMRPRRRATCKAVTDPHYMTFDKTRFDSMGMCSYVMVRTRSNSTAEPFRVVAVNEQPAPNLIVSHVREVFVEFRGNQSMRFMAGPNITLNGVNVNPGYDRDGIRIRVVGRFWLVDFNFSLTIRWDGQDRIRISVWAPLRYQVEGVCGNFNDNPIDDLMTPSGDVVTNYDQFVDSWIVEGYGAEGCPVVGPADFPTLPLPPACADPLTRSRHHNSCYPLIDPEGPMRGCQAIENATAAYHSCLYDQCAFDGDKEQKERVMASYVENCVETDDEDRATSDNDTTEAIVPPVWRPAANLTDPECPPNSHFSSCIPQCQPTCNDPNMTSCVSMSQLGHQCVEGCTANTGYILSGSTYVRYEQCGCTLDGVYYRNGERFLTSGCTSRCSCVDGILSCNPDNCGELECRANGMGELACLPWRTKRCEVSGNLHFLTYDTQAYNLKRPCSYTLTQSLYPNGFSVILTTVQENTFTRMHMVTVTLPEYNVNITLNRTPMGAMFLINGQPYQQWTSPNIGTPNVVVQRNGLFITITTVRGLGVEFDGHQLRVTLPVTHSNMVTGLCGNMNEIAADDFLLPSGNSASSAAEFAVQYETEACTMADEPTIPICTDTHRLMWSSNSMCGMLRDRNGPLKPCVTFIRFSTTMRHYTQCIDDMCASQGSNITLTEAIESYARECLSQGVPVCNWRQATPSQSNFTMCASNSHYNDCANGCPDSCGVVPFPERCPMIESCVCDDGYVLQGTQCVPLSQCNCHVNNNIVEYGTSYLTSNCKAECTCYGNNKTVCNPVTGCANMYNCVEENGLQSCVKTLQPRVSCTSIGGLHYTTFDGSAFRALSTCTYAMVRSLDGASGIPPFYMAVTYQSVTSYNSAVKEIRIVYENTTVVMARHGVMINGVYVIPGTQYNGVNVTQVGGDAVVVLPFQLVIQWNGMDFLQIDAWRPLMGKIEGLCGDFDDNPNNDFVPRPDTSNTAASVLQHWELTNETGCSMATPPAPPCDGNGLTIARSRCDVLLDGTGPFSQCHDWLEPRHAYQACVYQSCTSGHDPAAEMRVISSYGNQCRDRGGVPGTLDITSVPCPMNSTFQACGMQCQALCTDREASFCSSISLLGQQCVSGCQCDDGSVYENGSCVSPNSCGCLAPWGAYITARSSLVDAACSIECDCVSGVMTCRNTSCYMDQYCGARNGVHGCHWINQCEYNNGGCSHSCSMQYDVIVCNCPPNYALSENGTTCVSTNGKVYIFVI
ncbi:IgGFc-binding protein-like [Ciona intestinalis]